jgi:GTP cyclohydrolase I
MEDKSSDAQMVKNTIAAEKLVRGLIEFIGEDPYSEHTRDTPRRVIKSYKELFGGYSIDPKSVLGTVFQSKSYDQMVICKDIELYSTCAHHMIPFHGKAHVGYIPGKQVVGLSKLARLVDVFARRMQIQEELTDQIADTLSAVIKPKGVMVIIEAKHFCMCSRGVAKQHSSMVTSSIRGVFDDAKVRQEFMSLIK